MRRWILIYLILSMILILQDATSRRPAPFSNPPWGLSTLDDHQIRQPLATEQDGSPALRQPAHLHAFAEPSDPIETSANSPYIQFDSHGLIVQSDGDGGDTAQRTGMFYLVYRNPEAFARALDLLEVAPGVYVRHPFQPEFRSDPSEFSRDQQRPLVIALGAYGMHDRLWRMARAHIARLGKYQNRDFIGPSHLGEYIRAFEARALYPVLLATDGVVLFNSIRIAVGKRINPDWSDDNNHLLTLIQAQNVMPTPLSWLARKLYKRFRPANNGNSFLGESCPVQGALAWYHRPENGGNPLIAEAYREAVRNL